MNPQKSHHYFLNLEYLGDTYRRIFNVKKTTQKDTAREHVTRQSVLKQNDAQNPADYAKHHQTGHFIHLIGGNRAREHRTLTYFVYKSKTRTVPRKTSDNMGKKRYFCSHCNDFVSRGTRSRHLKDLAATNEAFFDSDNSEVPSESDREDLGAFEDNLECQSGQDNRNRSSNGKANNLSCDRKW